MLHILNCIVDDPKFIDDMIEVFDYTQGEHQVDYCFITDSANYQLHIKSKQRVKMLRPFDVIPFIVSHRIDVVMIHGMNSLPHIVLLQIPSIVKVVWLAWGYDLYRFPVEERSLIKLPLFKPLTKKVRNSDRNAYWARKKSFLVYLLKDRKSIRKAISRVDFFSGVVEMEYDLMRKNKFFKAEQVVFNYFKLDVEGCTFENIGFVQGNHIVLGNSASDTNNHLDALEYLKGIDLKGRKIIIPFSYQRSKYYVEKVKMSCQKHFDNITFLEHFLPLKEYNEYLSSCGYAIYFFESQAAMGNVRDAFLKGRKVFLSETSVMYKYFHSLGFIVFSVQKQLNAFELSTPLSNEQRLYNLDKMKKYQSSEKFVTNIKQMLEKIERSVNREK